MTPKVGDVAQDFSVPDQAGKVHSLKDYRGQWVLLYFYPKDDTPGCTRQACAIRDGYSEFEKRGIKVLGVSADSVESHQEFEKKYQLPFTLLADEKKDIVHAYGMWRLKEQTGSDYDEIERTSFLIDPQGNIAYIFEKVSPDTHMQEVLSFFDGTVSA